jgi:aminoglycoside 2''-phosphotransferase
MTDRAEAYAARIQAIAPDLVVRSAVFNDDGLVNDVVIVNRSLVFRFVKNQRSIDSLAGELQAEGARHPSVCEPGPPDPFYVSRDDIAYELLRGETLTRDLLLGLGAEGQQAIADQSGGFLRALHTAPTGGDLPASRAPVRHSDWVERRRQIGAVIYPLLQPHQRAWAQNLFDGMLSDPHNFDYEPRLINGDLAQYHILCDRAAGRLNAIIDFGMAGLGDPATDLDGLLHVYGGFFVRRLFRVYPEARGLLRRARFYAQGIELEWTFKGLTSGDQFWFTAHLGDARDLLEDDDSLR